MIRAVCVCFNALLHFRPGGALHRSLFGTEGRRGKNTFSVETERRENVAKKSRERRKGRREEKRDTYYEACKEDGCWCLILTIWFALSLLGRGAAVPSRPAPPSESAEGVGLSYTSRSLTKHWQLLALGTLRAPALLRKTPSPILLVPKFHSAPPRL